MKALEVFLAVVAWPVVLTTSGAAQVEVFRDQIHLERTLLRSSPESAVCERGNSYRLSYEYEISEYEIAHCRHHGNATKFRLAVTQHAVFLDIDAVDAIGPEFDLEVHAHLARLDAIAQLYGFSYDAAVKCLLDALASAAMQWRNQNWRLEPTEVRSAQYLLQCEARRRGVSLVVASNNRF
jgi:hypothetical protein